MCLSRPPTSVFLVPLREVTDAVIAVSFTLFLSAFFSYSWSARLSILPIPAFDPHACSLQVAMLRGGERLFL